MSFEIELGSLGLFRPGLYFILRAQSSLIVSLLSLGPLVVKGARFSGEILKCWWSFRDSLLFHFSTILKKGKTMLYPPNESLELYTLHVLIGTVGHRLVHIYLMCKYVSDCEGFCIPWPISPLERAEISREEKRLTVPTKSLEPRFSIKLASIQINPLLNGGIWNALSETFSRI